MNNCIESTIISRRSVKKTKTTDLPLEIIEEILQIAAFAPFHTKVEPWSVVTISTMDEKHQYAESVLNSLERMGKYENLAEDVISGMKEKQSEYFLATPITLLVTTDVFPTDKGNLDSIGATSSFIQNIQLLCWDKNIGCVWRTPGYIFDPMFASELGIDATKKVVGALHLGYFDDTMIPKPKQRRDGNEWIKSLSSN